MTEVEALLAQLALAEGNDPMLALTAAHVTAREIDHFDANGLADRLRSRCRAHAMTNHLMLATLRAERN